MPKLGRPGSQASGHAGTPAADVLGRPFWDSFIPHDTLLNAQARVLQSRKDQGSCLLPVEQDMGISERSSLLLKFMCAALPAQLQLGLASRARCQSQPPVSVDTHAIELQCECLPACRSGL